VRAKVARGEYESDGVTAYLEMLAPRLEAAARLLSPRRERLWVHLDWRAAYLVRVLLDEILVAKASSTRIVCRRARTSATSDERAVRDARSIRSSFSAGRRAKLVPPTRLEPIGESFDSWDDAGRPFTAATPAATIPTLP